MEHDWKGLIDFVALLLASAWIIVALKYKLIQRNWVIVAAAIAILYPMRAVALYLWT